MAKYGKVKVNSNALFMHFLSLCLSLYVGYVFIAYTDSVNEQPMCASIRPDQRRFINIYGYITVVLAVISLILLSMFLYK